MKFEIDTENKEIKVKSDVNLGEMVKELGTIFPKGEWKKYKLVSCETVYQDYTPMVPFIQYDQQYDPNYPKLYYTDGVFTTCQN